MGRLRERAGAPQYIDDSLDGQTSDDSEGSSPRQLETREGIRRGPYCKKAAVAGKKRTNVEMGELPHSQRRRSSPCPDSNSEAEDELAADPIESADESADEESAAARDADFQPEEEEMAAGDGEEEEEEDVELAHQSDESGWDIEESEEEVLPHRRDRNQPRSLWQQRAQDDGGNGGGRCKRLHGAARPSYHEAPSEDDDDDEEEEGDDEGDMHAGRSRQQRGAGKPSYRESGSSEEEEEDEEEQPLPRRSSVGRATRTDGRRPARQEGRRTGRERQRVCYNEDALLPEFESEEEESSEEESGEEEEEQPARPTRRAAKAAGRAIRKQAGGGKQRKQPRRGAAPVRRQAVVESSDEGGSGNGSGSDEGGSELQGSDASMSGSESDGPGLDLDRCQVERILESRAAADGGGQEFLCKFEGKSYRKTAWLPYDVLAVDRLQLLRNFQKKKAAGEVDPYGDLVQGVHPDWVQVDRVIAHRCRLGRTSYLVKWRGLGYAESTWEAERDLAGEESHIERYERYNRLPNEDEEADSEKQELVATLVPDFCHGRQLRDYQRVSLEWNIINWSQGRNCILGDEMGLGKTAQSISVLAYQKQYGGIRGPFLVIAPLTTLGHWQREIETWTDMNCVVYAGGQADRDCIQRYDLFFSSTDGSGRRRRGRTLKPNVVLASYETVLRDRTLFNDICWQTVIIDEAHRMKSTGSSTRAAIASMDIEWLLLLTGTPVQNNMRELFGILNLLDRQRFADEDAFLERFGDDRTGMTPEQVKDLQGELRPILLRRMKEDVETLPEKEEVIIWVELTPEQRAYYKAIYENQIGTLLAGASAKNMPNLRNLAMELRKVCCHPFLCNGLEEDIQRRRLEAGAAATSELEQLVQASGKMVLLNKLLPKLRAEGHKVLIFSQFKMMLDVLEDYLRLGGHPFERIDGSTSSRDRQAAIDRFSKEGSESFVFLLSTRAGGQGITLTAADTCVIFDSDWNPQNDMQAMARCHRIGQEREVTIYRLVSKNSYEENIFQMSSRKYGLDEAILGNLGGSSDSGGGGGGNPEDDVRKIADLLKYGAHGLQEMEAASEQGGAFAAEGIDQILRGRTEKRQIGGRAGNTFSVATFAVGQTPGKAASRDDKAYWAALLPDAVQGHEAAEAASRAPVVLAPRRRKQVDYKGQMDGKVLAAPPSQDDEDYVAEGDGEDEDLVLPKGKKQKRGKESGPAFKRWSNGELAAFEAALLQLGAGRTEDVRREANLQDRSAEECRELEAGMLRALRRGAELAKQHEEQLKAQRAEQKQQQQQHAAAVGAAEAAADAPVEGEGEGEGGKPKSHKKPRDSAVQEALERYVQAELQEAPPAVAHALRSQQFLNWAASHAQRGVEQLRVRKALAAWMASGDDGASPGRGPPLPFLRSKHAPADWWREADTRAALRAVHQLGWQPRKGNQRSDIVLALLSDERFGFRKRVRLNPASHPVAAPAEGQLQQQPQDKGQGQAAAGGMDVDQPECLPAPAAPAPAPPSPAKQALAASPATSPSKHQGPHPVDQKTWNNLIAKALPDYLNLVLSALATQPAVAHKQRAAQAEPPAGARQREGVDKGSSADLHRAGGTHATPPAPAAGQGSAAAYTNPLTSQPSAGGSGGKAAADGSGGQAAAGGGSASRKPPLALTGTGHKGKERSQQQSILSFMQPKQKAAAAVAADDSPGHKENQGGPPTDKQQLGGTEAEVIVVD